MAEDVVDENGWVTNPDLPGHRWRVATGKGATPFSDSLTAVAESLGQSDQQS